jgi:hypothetical protein
MSCTLNLEVPRINSTFQEEREHLVGEMNLTYMCEFEGYPLPNVAFYFNGVHIPANNTNGICVVSNTLIIPSPQVYHSGIYQCIVSNEIGDDQAAWLLEIRQPSMLLSPSQLLYVLEQQLILVLILMLPCRSTTGAALRL